MRPYFPFLFLAVTAGLLPLHPMLHAADAPIPQAYPADRYQRIWTKSPFTVASVVAAPVAEGSFTDSMTLAGLTTVNGKPFVTVRDTTSNQSQIITSEANSDGVLVVSVVNDLDPSKVVVVLKKGEQSGTLKFNVQAFATNNPAPNNPVQPNGGNIPPPTMPRNRFQPGMQPGQPGQPGRPNNIRRRTIPLPGTTQRPRNNGTIPPPTPR